MATNGTTNVPDVQQDPESVIYLRPRTEARTQVESRKLGMQQPENTIIQFPEVQYSPASRFGISKAQASAPILTQRELYPVREAYKPEHITALRLLDVAVGRCKRALAAMPDDLAADTEIQKVQVILPELFCCRTLGDGFGTIINGIMGAFENLQGEALNTLQIRALITSFSLLKDRPFLSADEAEETLSLLERVGLQPHPAELMEFLSSASDVR